MSAPDVLVIGAGIFGLSAAWSCRRAGMSVRVIEAMLPGAGASGGIVGALTPHAPSRWRAMMAFQFHALLSLEARIAEIEAATGLDCGYARTGRLTPLDTEKARAGADRDAEAAPGVWGEAARFEVLESLPPEALGWIRPEAARHGVVRETVSARVDPRAYVAALAAALGNTVETGVRVTGLVPGTADVQTSEGPLSAGHLVVAA